MDTDDLSKETYRAIIIEAERFHHDLTLQFGLLAKDCKDEEDYLNQASELISELRSLHENEFDEVFFGIIPDRKSLNSALDRITENISQVRKIPEDQRTYENW